WSVTYRAYGNVAQVEIADIDNPLRFQGQYFDAETGLHYNRHRYYNPNTGCFLTPDPIKLAGGLNNYQYVNNPTGWVDPLGLNSQCPPGNGEKPGTAEDPIAKARVEQAEPEAPSPQMTSEQRRTRLDELSEANAKRRVQEYEAKYNMHTIGKHSPEVPDSALKQRAIDGTDPITGQTPRSRRGNPSSQFKSWKLQMHAINEALTRKTRGLPQHTGVDSQGNPILRIEQPVSGRGYKPNRTDANNPHEVTDMNGAEIKFNKHDTDAPFTAYPIE
ncbi:RHS repeat-associated core domain-containing protein, partial [Pseudomonas indica]|uniref:RHS repeat-associated core domain-containing protein n=1 Tax=Pseudomonas indica TaxID=137658 RepID=UPI0020D19359